MPRRPESAWRLWRGVRDDLFRTHPQSPLPPGERPSFGGVEYYPYDAALRVLADVAPAGSESLRIAGSAGSAVHFTRFGIAEFELGGEPRSLELYWLEGYGGGVFLPFNDATTGHETYGAGATCSTRSRAPTSAPRRAGSSSTSTSRTTRRARTTSAGRARSRRPRTRWIWPCAAASERSETHKSDSVRSLSATKAARRFSALLDAVQRRRESFLVVRRGRAVARLEPARATNGKLVKDVLRSNPPDWRWAAELRELRASLAVEDHSARGSSPLRAEEPPS